ncbi:hypothetical protein TVAG_058220 [Trichomonas vaginalis G3]|uniref:Uncharacterized protein n=1 Tax=Trichomonas vaginalis (strain ATCC PRA-98 / G3) TaxID=412133 RepID=A2EQ82_TRIV3|nr:myosin rod-like family protein [Trichomonas vaginalis G3]EAY05165.1 hypothetical protein TVAG_058220 [Trichomonas vaginalis G3]KAI5522934.1 myosin rod-like family protein [Trichomonas vaginalis G3]|eukprot:XP_001317388.1 hypothetical protein [Trichomonas vaginalis G3]
MTEIDNSILDESSFLHDTSTTEDNLNGKQDPFILVREYQVLLTKTQKELFDLKMKYKQIEEEYELYKVRIVDLKRNNTQMRDAIAENTTLKIQFENIKTNADKRNKELMQKIQNLQKSNDDLSRDKIKLEGELDDAKRNDLRNGAPITLPDGTKILLSDLIQKFTSLSAKYSSANDQIIQLRDLNEKYAKNGQSIDELTEKLKNANNQIALLKDQLQQNASKYEITIEILKKNYEELNNTRERELSQLNQTLNDGTDTIAAQKADIDKLTKQALQYQDLIKQLQEKISEQYNDHKQLENKLGDAQKRIGIQQKRMEQKTSEKEDEIEKLKHELEIQSDKNAELQAQNKQQQDQVSEYINSLQKLKHKLSKATSLNNDLNSQISELNGQLRVSKKENDLKNEKINILEDNSKQIPILESKLSDATTENDHLIAEVDDYMKKLAEKDQNISVLEKQLKENEMKYNSENGLLQNEKAQLNQKIQELNIKIEELQNEINELNDPHCHCIRRTEFQSLKTDILESLKSSLQNKTEKSVDYEKTTNQILQLSNVVTNSISQTKLSLSKQHDEILMLMNQPIKEGKK